MTNKGIATLAVVAVLALAGLAVPAAAQEVCTNETLPGIPHDQYLGTIGGLDFGNNFAGFDQTVWFNANGNYLWPQCADAVAWMPSNGIASTSDPLTRTIDFVDGCCILTSIRVASHEPTPGTLTIRALDSNGQQVGASVVYTDLVISDGCVLITTDWTECAAQIEITYTRGSELGIIELNYCCGEDETGGEGCTPGYWKANLRKNAGSNWAISPNTDFDTYFGVNFFNPNITFGTAIGLGGGGNNALARHAVAAVLSAANGSVDYEYTVAEIIAMVQAVAKPTRTCWTRRTTPVARSITTTNRLGSQPEIL